MLTQKQINIMKVVMMLLVMVLAFSACNQKQSQAISTDTQEPLIATIEIKSEPSPVPTKTPTKTLEPTATPSTPPTLAPSRTPKPTEPLNTIRFEWTIKTGKLQFIGVASDGTIYGINGKLYAVISKDGDVIKTEELALGSCVRPSSGGAGTEGTSLWFTVDPDGTVRSSADMVSAPCSIYPGDPPKLEVFDGFRFFPYADDFQHHKRPSIPDDFGIKESRSIMGNIFWLDGNRGKYDIQTNANTQEAAFINHNGGLTVFRLPETMEKLHEGGISFLVTPWDDVYFQYSTYDSLGNKTGKVFMRYTADGRLETIDQIPLLMIDKPLVMTDTPTTYLSQRREIYNIEGNMIVVYNTNFERIRSFTMPRDFPFSLSKYTFVGNDLAIYIFDVKKNTLTKYAFLNE